MKYMRLYADEHGESHAEEIEAAFVPMDFAPPAPPLEVSAPVDSTRHHFLRFPAGWDSGFHPSPRRQVFVVLSGEVEGTTSDGTTMSLVPGDVLLMEDTSGKGHTAKAMGGVEAVALMVHLE